MMIFNTQLKLEVAQQIFSCEASLTFQNLTDRLSHPLLAILTLIGICRPLIKKLLFQNVSHLL